MNVLMWLIPHVLSLNLHISVASYRIEGVEHTASLFEGQSLIVKLQRDETAHSDLCVDGRGSF